MVPYSNPPYIISESCHDFALFKELWSKLRRAGTVKRRNKQGKVTNWLLVVDKRVFILGNTLNGIRLVFLSRNNNYTKLLNWIDITTIQKGLQLETNGWACIHFIPIYTNNVCDVEKFKIAFCQKVKTEVLRGVTAKFRAISCLLNINMQALSQK